MSDCEQDPPATREVVLTSSLLCLLGLLHLDYLILNSKGIKSINWPLFI